MRTNILKQSVTISAVFSLLLMVASAMADSLDVEVSQGAFVYNADSSDARLLIEFALPEVLQGAQIQFAELRVPIISIIPDTSILTLYCRPLLLSWNEGDVVWEDIGDSPDTLVVSRRGAHYGTSELGSQTAYFNITSVVKKWLNSTMDNNGLILYANPRGRARFACQRQENEPFAAARLRYEQFEQ